MIKVIYTLPFPQIQGQKYTGDFKQQTRYVPFPIPKVECLVSVLRLLQCVLIPYPKGLNPGLGKSFISMNKTFPTLFSNCFEGIQFQCQTSRVQVYTQWQRITSLSPGESTSVIYYVDVPFFQVSNLLLGVSAVIFIFR